MMKSEEEVMLTESLMSKRDSAKVKSGLIQFLGSRVDQEEEEYGWFTLFLFNQIHTEGSEF